MELSKSIDDKVYDLMYEDNDRTYENPSLSPYYPMFCAAKKRVQAAGISGLLEVGCGSGTLAEMVMPTLKSYRGFDISPVGIEKAKAKNPSGSFFVGSANDPDAYVGDYDGILCCEVLEHISDDLDAIALWPQGTKVVCSVPNFDYDTHYRMFVDEDDVRSRYAGLIDIRSIDRIAKPIFPHRFPLGYLRSIWWAAAKGNRKRVAGLLGIRKFDWYAGWFLFSGTRK